ncbi:MAG TPA: sensor histidine kinase, partial [Bacillota bacterium]
SLLAPYLPEWLQGPWAQTPAAVMVFMFFYRYRKLLTPLQRQQARLLMVGVLAALTLLSVLSLLNPVWTPGLTAEIAANTLLYVVLLIIPTAVTVAVLRYGLWDLDRVISRAVVYGLLSAGLIGLYMLIVGFLGALFQARGNLMVALAGTAAVAVLFQPLRQWLQNRADRLVYGDRGDPYAVLSGLARRLGAALAPEEALAAVVASVREAFNLPYAAIVLQRGADEETAAESGHPDADPVEMPLYHQGERVGRLRLGRRAPGTDFGQADRALLEDLAGQAGAAAHAVGLTRELQRSRRRLVTAREDERRRLRRDLHDGIAPMLAAQSFRAATARHLLRDAPGRAEEVLSELEADMERTLADLRRLVYNLRPPALDSYGLVEAIRQYAATLAAGGQEQPRALRVVLSAPEPLPLLDAATEAAAFRIVQEALANAARHAGARTAWVRIRVNGALEVAVEDDGNGLPPDPRPGVGLSSMRERAEELGGTLTLSNRSEGGVRVLARLPVQLPAHELPKHGGDARHAHPGPDRR